MKKRYFYVAYSFTTKNYQGAITNTGSGSTQLITMGKPLNHSMKTMTDATRYIEDCMRRNYNFHNVEVTILNIIELVEGEE